MLLSSLHERLRDSVSSSYVHIARAYAYDSISADLKAWWLSKSD
jgi:hypothetical protein